MATANIGIATAIEVAKKYYKDPDDEGRDDGVAADTLGSFGLIAALRHLMDLNDWRQRPPLQNTVKEIAQVLDARGVKLDGVDLTQLVAELVEALAEERAE